MHGITVSVACVVCVVPGGLLNVQPAALHGGNQMSQKLGVDIATIPLEIAATVPVSTSAPVLAVFARQVGETRAVAKGSAS